MSRTTISRSSVRAAESLLSGRIQEREYRGRTEMSRKIYNRLSLMAVSWLDESTLGHLLRHLARTRLRASGFAVRGELRRLVNPRRLGGVLQVSPGRTPKLYGASAAPLPGYVSSGLGIGIPLPAASESLIGKRLGLARPL